MFFDLPFPNTRGKSQYLVIGDNRTGYKHSKGILNILYYAHQTETELSTDDKF